MPFPEEARPSRAFLSSSRPQRADRATTRRRRRSRTDRASSTPRTPPPGQHSDSDQSDDRGERQRPRSQHGDSNNRAQAADVDRCRTKPDTPPLRKVPDGGGAGCSRPPRRAARHRPGRGSSLLRPGPRPRQRPARVRTTAFSLAERLREHVEVPAEIPSHPGAVAVLRSAVQEPIRHSDTVRNAGRSVRVEWVSPGMP